MLFRSASDLFLPISAETSFRSGSATDPASIIALHTAKRQPGKIKKLSSRSYSPLFTLTLILQKSDRGRFSSPIPRDTTGSSTAKPVCAPLRSALSERPPDVQRCCPLPCRCLLVQERQPLAGLIAQKTSARGSSPCTEAGYVSAYYRSTSPVVSPLIT